MLVIADISEFYHSIYTHSIPWALHTKATAKANRGLQLFGNAIDKLIRESQDGQTMGIPIGPDSSFVIAEILLTTIDAELVRRIPGIRGLRFIDDYELSCSDMAPAEAALAALQGTLLEFELRVNPRKTEIKVAPLKFDPVWVSELRALRFRNSASGRAGDLIRYFDQLSEFLANHPTDHVAKYGLARLRGVDPSAQNAGLLTALICQTVTASPGSIREGVEILVNMRDRGYALPMDIVEQCLSTVVEVSAPLGHHYETAWAIWAAIAFNRALTGQAGRATGEVDNSVIAIIALDAAQQGLLPGLNTAKWEQRMTTPELYEDEWLLCYEANFHNWLPSLGGGDHVAADQNFGFLKAQGVHFYTPTAQLAAPLVAPYP